MKLLTRDQTIDGSTGAVFPFRPNLEPSTRVAKQAYDAVRAVLEDLPQSDNVPGAVERMLRANGLLRNLPWPAPYDQTRHVLHLGDARSLSWDTDHHSQIVAEHIAAILDSQGIRA